MKVCILKDLLLIIPAYNEEDNIQRVVEDLIKNFSQYDYIIVNDGSKDSTLQIYAGNMVIIWLTFLLISDLKALFRRDSNMHIVRVTNMLCSMTVTASTKQNI